jgi:hypothetical protein
MFRMALGIPTQPRQLLVVSTRSATGDMTRSGRLRGVPQLAVATLN